MVGIYLNEEEKTEYCVKKLLAELNREARAISMDDENIVEEVKANTYIILAYPVNHSRAPKAVYEFIRANTSHWKGKRVLCVATMETLHGEGTSRVAMLLEQYGAVVLGGLQLKAPETECDRKIRTAATRIKKGSFPRQGLHIFHQIFRKATTLLGDTAVEQVSV